MKDTTEAQESAELSADIAERAANSDSSATRPVGDNPPSVNLHSAAADETLLERVISGVRGVYDPEIPLNIYDLGLIYRIDINTENHVAIDMTLTSPMCPVAGSLPGEVENAARGVDGAVVPYCAVENSHANHILDVTTAPASIADSVARDANQCAIHISEALEVIGLVAAEMFVTPGGGVLVNEIAPRPHNSGHWTIDACLTSQFEQVVRAVCGLPLGSPERLADAEMKNLLGDAVHGWSEIFADPDVKLHLYGKTQTREGRKMGHMTRLKSLSS